MFIRLCPQCNKELSYSLKKQFNRAERFKSLCKSCSASKWQKGKVLSNEHKLAIKNSIRNLRHSLISKEKLFEILSKAQHRRYGTQYIVKSERTRIQQYYWSLAIRKRDKFICVYCGSKENTNAHHIFSQAKHPELADSLNNGITLCYNCHKEEHKLNGLL